MDGWDRFCVGEDEVIFFEVVDVVECFNRFEGEYDVGFFFRNYCFVNVFVEVDVRDRKSVV